METRSCGSFKGVIVQVAGLVATPGGSWGRDQVLWKLSGVEVQVAGFVRKPGGSCDGNQVLWRLQKDHGAGCRTCYSTWGESLKL